VSEPAPPDRDQTFGMFTVDARLMVRTWDPWIARATGIAPEQALNRPVGAVIPGIEDRGFVDVLRSVLERGTVEILSPALHRYLFACRPRTPAAHFEQMQQRVTVGPVREDGRITGVLVTVEDVTARMDRDRSRTATVESIAGGLGEPQWSARQKEVRDLARHGQDIVESLVMTLREQHRNFNILSSALDLLAIADLDIVEPMIGCLASEDVDLRVQAALILGERRDPRAIPALMNALADADTNVRFHAIEALGGLRAAPAIDALLTIAEGRDFFLAFPAIQALARIGDTNIAPRLVPLLADEMLSPAVVEALGELGDDAVAEPLVALMGQPGAPVEAIAEALTALHDRYERRYEAGDQIATVVRRAATASATQQLLDAVHRVSSDRLPGLARVLGWLDGHAVQRALTRMLGQATVRAQVVEALVRHGAGVVDLLIEQLQAEDLETRQAASVALGRIGDRRATPPLIAALDDPELAVPAAGALARIGDPAAFDALLALVGDPDSAVRQATIAALNSIGHMDMPRRVLALLTDPNPLVRESAARVAGYFGYAECLDAVLDCCSDPEEAVRRAAVEQLPMFDNARAIARLARALAADTPSVRASAAAAFARADTADAVEPLERALDDEDPWVRYFALRSLGSHQQPSIVPAVRDRLERDPAGQVRLAAIDVLGRLQPPDIMSILAPLALSDDGDTARAAIRALRHVQESGAHATLEALSRAGEVWRRTEAAAALGQRGGTAALSTLQWIAAADESSEVAETAIAGLVTMASRDDHGAESAHALVELLAEPSRRESSIAALARLPVRRAGDVAAGLAHPSPHVRRSTVEALSRMRHTDATRWIETALDDDAPAVRSTAAAELRHLGSRHAVRKLILLSRGDPDADVRRAATMASGLRETD
jgi:HEAT repeat protein